MIQFYKPNSKNTGSACSFSYNKKDKALWVNFIRQASWNAESKTGTFKGATPDKKASSKFSVTELAGLVHAIETNGEYGNFHGNKERNTTFKFSPYVREGNQVGYSFSLNQNNSQENLKKSFIIGFTFAEGRMLKEYALTVLKNYFTEEIDTNQYNNSNQQAPKSQQKTEEKVENTAPTQDNTTEDDGIPW
tara:strand:- start:334 stop:906 length:573 start_codon:yes stop_codon:yes gene_type:complete